MTVTAIAQFSPVDRPGGLSLRDQMRMQLHAISAEQKRQVAAAPDAAARRAVRERFEVTRKELGEKYAAMLCSVVEFTPKPAAPDHTRVLMAYYRLLGERGRAVAAEEGRPFRLEDLDHVKLTREDVAELRAQFGDEDVKKALPLLQRHIMHERWMTSDAIRYMNSAEFIAFHTVLEATHDRMERGIETHRRKLDERDIRRLHDERQRKTAHWTDRIVIERARDKRVVFVSMGGHLVPIGEKPE